jgi:hypothetical protein
VLSAQNTNIHRTINPPSTATFYSCVGWVYVTSGTSPALLDDVPGANCWPLAGHMSGTAATDREIGCKAGVKCASAAMSPAVPIFANLSPDHLFTAHRSNLHLL